MKDLSQNIFQKTAGLGGAFIATYISLTLTPSIKAQATNPDRPPYKIAQAIAPKCQLADVQPYVEMLSDVAVRDPARKELVKICGSSAIPHLEKLIFKEQEPDVRSQIILVLAQIGDNPAQALLIKLANTDSTLNVQIQAVRALGNPKFTMAVKPLLTLLNSPAAEVKLRQEAALAIGKIANPNAISPLISEMKNISNPVEIRKSAGMALVSIKDPAIPALEAVAKDTKSGLQNQYWSIRALVMMDSARSNTALDINQTLILKILNDALKPPNNIVELDRGLGRPWICRWSWASRRWSKCR